MRMPLKVRQLVQMILCGLFVMATCGKPGEGPRAAAGYAQGKRIIDAINMYHTKNQRNPESLDELVPNYLTRPDLILKVAANSEYPFVYKVKPNGYALYFRYGGPGLVDCVYDSESGKWRCYGRY